MKADEVTYGTHTFGMFEVSIQACIGDSRPADAVDFFEVLVHEKRDGALFYVDINERFKWFEYLSTFSEKLTPDRMEEFNARVGTLFHKIAMPTFKLSRHSIPRLEMICVEATKRAKKGK